MSLPVNTRSKAKALLRQQDEIAQSPATQVAQQALGVTSSAASNVIRRPKHSVVKAKPRNNDDGSLSSKENQQGLKRPREVGEETPQKRARIQENDFVKLSDPANASGEKNDFQQLSTPQNWQLTLQQTADLRQVQAIAQLQYTQAAPITQYPGGPLQQIAGSGQSQAMTQTALPQYTQTPSIAQYPIGSLQQTAIPGQTQAMTQTALPQYTQTPSTHQYPIGPIQHTAVPGQTQTKAQAALPQYTQTPSIPQYPIGPLQQTDSLGQTQAMAQTASPQYTQTPSIHQYPIGPLQQTAVPGQTQTMAQSALPSGSLDFIKQSSFAGAGAGGSSSQLAAKPVTNQENIKNQLLQLETPMGTFFGERLNVKLQMKNRAEISILAIIQQLKLPVKTKGVLEELYLKIFNPRFPWDIPVQIAPTIFKWQKGRPYQQELSAQENNRLDKLDKIQSDQISLEVYDAINRAFKKANA